jgi:PAS domain S-box-containing protein
MDSRIPPTRGKALITGNDEMADRIRSYPWADTSLGAIDDWSETLVATVNLMLHSAFPAMLAWGEKMVILYNGPAISTLLGKHPRALGGRYQEVFPEAWELVHADWEACLQRGETTVRDNVYISVLLDGKLEAEHWSYTLTPVYEHGQIVGAYDTYRNTSETVLAAEKLRESQQRLKLATEVGQLGVFIWDIAQDCGTWENDLMYQIFGRKLEDGPVDRTAFLNDVVHPDHRIGFQEAVERASSTRQPFHFEGMIRHPDETFRWIEINGQLEDDDDATSVLILGTVRDVTASKDNERVLRENAKRLAELAAIVESSDDVIVSKDLDGIITSWNASATRVFGYSADEMIGRSVLQLVPDYLQSEEMTILSTIRAGRRLENFETVRVAKDGKRLEVSLTVSPMKDSQGRVFGASKILRDISSRRRMESSLLQAEKIAATGRMAATIAHEINNPLEAVTNLLFLLRTKVNDPEGNGYLTSAEDELKRVSHLTKQTLGYYREHADASRASLGQIAEHALEIYEPRCTSAGIAIKRFLDSSRKIMLRRGEMMQVISNLITNAIYAMQPGGTLSVSVVDLQEPQEGVLLTVADTGTGIAPADIPKIFDAFFTTRATIGTGIGLFVAKQFIEAHGGHIEIDSQTDKESHGTVARVFLPMNTAYEERG